MSEVEWTIKDRKIKLRNLSRELIYLSGDVIAQCENLNDYLKNGAQFAESIHKDCKRIQTNAHFYDFLLRKFDRNLNSDYIFNNVFSAWPIKFEVDNVRVADIKSSSYDAIENTGTLFGGYFEDVPITRKDFILFDDSTDQKLPAYIEINNNTDKSSWAHVINTEIGDNICVVISAPDKEESPIAGISSMKNYSWNNRISGKQKL